MRLLGFIAIIICILSSGCNSIAPDQPQFDSTLILPLGGTQQHPIWTIPQYKSSISQPLPYTCSTFFQSPSVPARNDCITDLATDIDAAYDQYETRINDNIGAANAGADTASFVTSTVSSAVGAKEAKTVLSTMSAVISGSTGIINKDVLYQQTVKILINQMRADRAKVMAQIRVNMQATLRNYSFPTARSDLLSYLHAGTLTAALTALEANTGAIANKCQAANAATKSAIENNQEVKRPADKSSSGSAPSTTSEDCDTLISATYKPTSLSDQITRLWTPDNGKTFNKANESVLLKCMTQSKLSPYLDEIDSTLFSDDDRRKVLQCFASENAQVPVPAAAVPAKAGATDVAEKAKAAAKRR